MANKENIKIAGLTQKEYELIKEVAALNKKIAQLRLRQSFNCGIELERLHIGDGLANIQRNLNYLQDEYFPKGGIKISFFNPNLMEYGKPFDMYTRIKEINNTIEKIDGEIQKLDKRNDKLITLNRLLIGAVFGLLFRLLTM